MNPVRPITNWTFGGLFRSNCLVASGFLFLSFLSLSAQNSFPLEDYVNAGNKWIDAAPDSAIYYWSKAIESFERNSEQHPPETVELIINTSLQLGKTYLDQKREYQNARLSFEKAYDMIEALLEGKPELAAVCHNELGRVFYYQEHYGASETHFKAALYIQKEQLQARQAVLGRHYTNVGRVQLQRRALYAAEENFKAAIQCFSIEQENNYDLAMVYSFLAKVYEELGDYGQALLIFDQASVHTDSSNSIHPNFFFADMGIINMKMGDPQKAIDYFKQTVEQYAYLPLDNPIVSLMHSNLAKAYYESGQYKAAKKEILLTLTFQDSSVPPHYQDNFENSSLLAQIYLGMGKLEEARKIWLDLLTWADYPVVRQNNLLFFAYKYLGDLEYLEGNAPEALAYYQKAIKANRRGQSASGELSSGFAYEYEMLSIYESMMGIYKMQMTDNKELLHEAYQTVQHALQLINQIKNSFLQESSILFLQKDVRPLYEAAIELAHYQYKQTGNSNYLADGFKWMELSKATLLFQQIKNTQALENGQVPVAILHQEKELIARIHHFEQLVYEASLENNDEALLQYRKSELLKATSAYDSLRLQLEKDYPKYYQLKYQESVVGLEALQQQLSPEMALISYYVGMEKIYRMIITSAEISFQEILMDSNLIDQSTFFFRFCAQKEPQNKVNEQRFAQIGFELYQQLLPGKLNEISHFVIIPDGILHYLPFEALLTKEIKHKDFDFRTLPYLIYQKTISYSEDISIWAQAEILSSTASNSLGFVGMAPSYEINATDSVFSGVREVDYGGMKELPGAKKEVEVAARLFSSKTIIGLLATEKLFKEALPSATILHLATHGITNDKDPLYSYLALAPPTDSSNDGRLYAYEIYGLTLPYQLAVLSACETGFGKMEAGEGVMSIARAFKYAGVSNMLTSLWRAEDGSTKQLMGHFYRHLREGIPAPKALQEAKFAYLQEADKINAHPFYWANFNYSGGDISLQFSNRINFSWKYLIGFILLGCLIWSIYARVTKP